MNGPLTVLWEDPHGLAVNKPAGMLTQGDPAEEPTLESLVRSYLRTNDPASVYLGTVHRLDRPVSGVILWAKTPKAARRWSEQLAARKARKEYWALVAGDRSDFEPSGTWGDWLLKPDQVGRARISEVEAPGASRALTRYTVGQGEGPTVPVGSTWLQLFPETGRTHQLRAQLAHRGWPILGDATYGSTWGFPQGIALHARRLTIEHPVLRRPIVIEAPLPDAWRIGSI